MFLTDKDAFKSPYFIEHLANLVIPEGKDAVLSCACTGIPLPQLTWGKDGYILTPDKEFRLLIMIYKIFRNLYSLEI
jgi:hypothetical protein